MAVCNIFRRGGPKCNGERNQAGPQKTVFSPVERQQKGREETQEGYTEVPHKYTQFKMTLNLESWRITRRLVETVAENREPDTL